MARRVQDLLSKRLFLFDVEGVLCENIDEPKPTPYSIELLKRLRDEGKGVVAISNIARKSRRFVHSKLMGTGFDLEAGDVFTAGAVTASYLRQRKPAIRCFVISEGGLLEDLLEAGVEVVLERPVDVVVVGADRRLTYAELNHAMRLVLEGADLICAGCSTKFRGSFMGDEGLFLGEGAVTEAIRAATGKPAEYIGKPHPRLFLEVLRSEGRRAEEAVMIGDTLESDIVGAKSVGIDTVYVAKRELEAYEIPHEQRPDFAVRDVGELHRLLFQA